MDRTLVSPLKPTPEQAQLLHRTLQEHTACFHAVARAGFAAGCSNGWVKWESMTCSLATIAGRVVMGFTVTKHATQDVGGKVCSADLCFRHGHYFLHKDRR